MTEKKDSNQEIDLIELFTTIFDWLGKQIKWAFNIGLAIFYFFLRNSIWFIGFIVTGLILGYSVNKASEPYYTSNMIISTRAISDFEVIKNINHWDYVKEIDDTSITNGIIKVYATYLLDMNKDGKWDVIEDIETVNTIDTAITNYRLSSILSINIQATDTSKIRSLKDSTWSFIHRNPRVRARNNIRIAQQKQLLPVYEKEIRDLDSLKMKLYFETEKSSKTKLGDAVLVNEKTTKLYHGEAISLYKQKQSIEKSLNLHKNPFDLVFNFHTPTVSAPETKELSFKFVKLFLFFGFFLVLFIDQRKFFIQLIKDSKQK